MGHGTAAERSEALHHLAGLLEHEARPAAGVRWWEPVAVLLTALVLLLPILVDLAWRIGHW